MRNEQAALYARRSAMSAGLVVLLVAGVYGYRAYERVRFRKLIPAMVSAAIQQRSADFTYSQVEQGRTIFKIRASHATQFKDQNRAELDDVWITVYGREGNRNDNIHTRQCSYQPASGDVRCAGEVRIDLQGAQSAPNAKTPAAAHVRAPGGVASQSFQVTTSDLSFNRQTGEASTSQPVQFEFAGGHGRGVGVNYSTNDATVRVLSGIEFSLNPSPDTDGMPLNASGSNLEIHRIQRTVVLGGPAMVTEGARNLTADKITIALDEDFYAQSAEALGHASLHASDGARKLAMTADRFDAALNTDGGLEKVSADGHISGSEERGAAHSTFSAAHVDIPMFPGRNLPRQLTASGGVDAQSNQNGATQLLKTASLLVTFSAPPKPTTAKTSPGPAARQLRVESAETLAPATIESAANGESTTLHAQKFVARMTADNLLDQLLGHGGVQIDRTVPKSALQKSSADELAATFAPNGDWQTIDESGNVRLQQEDRVATAARAKINRATGEVALEGSPVVSDAVSRTTAASMFVNQTTGELRATGGVTSTYLPSSQSAPPISLGSGAAHISGDSVTGSTQTGQVTYSGHARLWQGQALLNADQIEIWRDDKKMKASGNVFAVFPQEAGTFTPPDVAAKSKAPAANSAASLWNVSAPVLTYWSDQGKALLEGSVTATSQDESLRSSTLEIFLSAPGSAQPKEPNPATAALAGDRQLNRIVARGNVVVKQADRQGTAEKAEYTAADQKFVLSGGQPTLTNSSRDTTSGHSLTFYVANDTILIDSQTGSRTLTRHRVEK